MNFHSIIDDFLPSITIDEEEEKYWLTRCHPNEKYLQWHKVLPEECDSLFKIRQELFEMDKIALDFLRKEKYPFIILGKQVIYRPKFDGENQCLTQPASIGFKIRIGINDSKSKAN